MKVKAPENTLLVLRRYLRLCAELENAGLFVPSTPAQVFTMIRRQGRLVNASSTDCNVT